MALHLDKKRIKKAKEITQKTANKVGSIVKGISDSIKEYNDKAPERRKEEIKRLQDELKIEQLRAKKRRLKEKNGGDDNNPFQIDMDYNTKNEWRI